MNVLFFLTPKANCTYLYDDYTIRQALERMEKAGMHPFRFSDVPENMWEPSPRAICSGPSKTAI